jgi:hypothetical protein
MSSRPPRSAATLAWHAAEVAVAVPQVVAHRMTRLAIAGPSPSQRDRREFTRMVAEKSTAFVAAWQGMAVQAMVANQALATSFWMAPLRGAQSPIASMAQLQAATFGVLAEGIAPVHRRAVANARRLAKTPLL